MADKKPGSDQAVYRSTAAVQYRATNITDKERESLLTLAGDRAPDPTIFEDEEPVFFRTISSNNKLDAYFTRMANSSLTNYAADATDPGVQFQNSHNGSGGFFGGGGEVGFGRSLQGKVTGPKTDRACVIDFYTLPGLKCGNLTSDEFIRGMRAGIYADVSIGFTPGRMICNICNNDFMRKWEVPWDSPERCEHWPGMTYEVEKGNRTTEVVCELSVEDAHLNEVSTVYDGATPGAGVVAVDMARLASAQGQLSEFDRAMLENVYRVRIAPPDRAYAVQYETRSDTNMTGKKITNQRNDEAAAETVEGEVDETETVIELDADDPENPSLDDNTEIVDDEDEGGEDEREPESPDQRMNELREKVSGVVRLGTDPYRAIEVMADHIQTLREKNKELARNAEFGEAYEKSLMAELDASVVRAFGAEGSDAAKKRYRKMARALSPDEVKEMIADLDTKGDERFKPGRSTEQFADNGRLDAETLAGQTERRGPTEPRLVGIRK